MKGSILVIVRDEDGTEKHHVSAEVNDVDAAIAALGKVETLDGETNTSRGTAPVENAAPSGHQGDTSASTAPAGDVTKTA